MRFPFESSCNTYLPCVGEREQPEGKPPEAPLNATPLLCMSRLCLLSPPMSRRMDTRLQYICSTRMGWDESHLASPAGCDARPTWQSLARACPRPPRRAGPSPAELGRARPSLPAPAATRQGHPPPRHRQDRPARPHTRPRPPTPAHAPPTPPPRRDRHGSPYDHLQNLWMIFCRFVYGGCHLRVGGVCVCGRVLVLFGLWRLNRI